MINISKLIFILILIILSQSIIAQSRVDGLRETNKNNKIALKDIVGNWFTADSAHSKISFINNNNYFISIDGIKHGVGDYIFNLANDSISVNGTAPNWPPYDCTLRLLNSELLEIEFYQYFSTVTTKMIYKR